VVVAGVASAAVERVVRAVVARPASAAR
jgi:hypothetical protein